MKNIDSYVRWLNTLRAGRRRAMALVLAMSVAVSGNVFWLMRTQGTALSEEPLCGITEHKHSDECYEKVLICEDEEHEHTDECYETKLICELDEHTHNEGCYIDISSHESAKDWEKTIPELTGDRAADLISVAASQLGYEEGADGYSRYGDWYGNADGDWNVMFVSFCLNYAGISKDDIPYGSGCWAWQVRLNESELLVTDLTDKPLGGDILLIDADGDGKCDLTGIIMSIDGDVISVAEGDVEGKTDVVKYDINDKAIFGYVSVNSLDEVSEEPAVEEPSEPAEGDTEEEQEVPAAAGFDARTKSGIKVHAEAADGAFPEGVVMSASDVDDKDVIAQAKEAAGKDLGDKEEVKGTLAVDITFADSEGNEVEPIEGKTVDVSIFIPESKQLDGKDYQLFHINEEGVESVSDAVVSAEEVAFTADGFSIFVVTATGQRDKDEVHAYIVNAGMTVDPADMNGPGYIRNTEKYPYMMRVGDEIVLVGKVDNGSYPEFTTTYGDVTITNISRTADEVRATIKAVQPSGWREDEPGHWVRNVCQIRLSGTDEIYYLVVDGKNNRDREINLDDYPAGETIEVTVKYHATIRVVATANGNTPWRPGDPAQLILDGGAYIHEGALDGRYFYANKYYEDNNDEEIVFDTAQGTKRLRIIVDPDMGDAIDHADLEIADGGKYTSVSIQGGGSEGLYKTVTTYQSYVNKVNSCYLYEADNDEVFIFHRDEQPSWPWPTTLCEPFDPPHFVPENYWHDPRFHPGDSQYELTSKYTLPPGYSWGEADATFSHKRFFYQDVDHARFDVGLDIVPESVKTYKWNGTGWDYLADEDVTYNIDFDNDVYSKTYKGTTEPIDIADYTEKVEHEIFNLDRTAVIDAYNKCPNHSGLDFTVHANSALLEFEAHKELFGRDLIADEFEFGIYTDEDCATTPIATAKNKGDGKVTFERMNFNADGDYTYYMKEIAGSNENIKYDQGIYRISVSISDSVADIVSFERREEGSSTWTSATSFKFDNYIKYKLPDTGGGGIVPYIAVGVTLIGTALIMLMLRRRKEVDL